MSQVETLLRMIIENENPKFTSETLDVRFFYAL